MANPRPPKKHLTLAQSEIARIDQIKRLAIIAMFLDDEFMERFVLKGGSALDIVLGVSARASIDVDFSLQDDFQLPIDEVLVRLERCLKSSFEHHALKVFDVTINEVPKGISPDCAHFWGGYQVHFKVIEQSKFDQLSHDLVAMRKQAIAIGSQGRFRIDISKYELCTAKVSSDLDGYRIYVYTPEMIVAEKLRAVCQQTHQYGQQMSRTITPRAKDFVDIYTLIEHFKLVMNEPENQTLISDIFGAKQVPLKLLSDISQMRDFHYQDFPSVANTVRVGQALKPFDFYFGFVMDLVAELEPLWHI